MTLAWKARRLCQASSQGPPQLPRPCCGPPASAPLRVHLLLPRGGSRERGSGPPQLLRFWSPAGSGGLASPRSLPQTCWSELACSACQKHFLPRSLTSWSVKELTSKACVLRCPEQGAWPVVDAHPAPARSSPREMLGRLLCSSFRSPNFCPASYSQGEFFRVSHSPRPL